MSARQMAANPVFHARSKDIEVDYHFVCDLMVNGTLQVRSHFQLADIFTKGLPVPSFLSHRSKL